MNVYNVLDFPCGVVPVSRVEERDIEFDKFPQFSRNNGFYRKVKKVCHSKVKTEYFF